MKGVFITGTDTGVGKTFFTSLLTRALRQEGIPAIALKPVASGDRADAATLAEAMDDPIPLSKINPVYFSSPLSPYAASIMEKRPFPWDQLRSHWQDISSSYSGPFLVEGIGGWRVPMDSTRTVREWAQELGLAVVIICRASLGTLNHTLLTVDSIRQTGLPLAGIVMNFHFSMQDEAAHTNPGILEEWSKVPVTRLPAAASQWEIPSWLRRVLV